MATYVFQNCFSVRLFLLSNLCMKRILPLLAALAFLSPAGAHAVPDEESEGPASPKAVKAKTAATPETPGKVVRLTLNECINRAVRNSRQLAAERHRLAALESQVNQIWWAPFSSFKIQAAFSMVPDRCIDTDILSQEGRIMPCEGDGLVTGDDDYWSQGWGPYFALEFKGGLPIYSFGKYSNAKDAMGHAYQATEANLPTFEHKIRFNVQRAYHAIVGAREMLYTITEGRKKLVSARKKVEENLEKQEGTETEIDLIKLKVFESEIDQMVHQTRQIEQIGLAALRFLVGGADKGRIDIPEDPQVLIESKLDSLEDYQGKALENRPELKALRHALKAMESKVALRRSEFWPDIALLISFRWVRTPGRTDIDNWVLKDSYNYGGYMPAVALGMNYNLDLGMDIHRLDQAKAELAALTSDQQFALEGIMLEVEKTYIQVATARDSLNTLEKSKRLTKGWLAAAVQSHAAGIGAAKEVKDALKEYFKIMASTHRSIGEFNAGLAALDKVTGDFDAGNKK